MNLSEQLNDYIVTTAKRLGIELAGNAAEWRTYSAERLTHLSTIVEEPGFEEAVVAEGINVMLKAAGGSVDLADLADRELYGIITGGLAIAARALLGGV